MKHNLYFFAIVSVLALTILACTLPGGLGGPLAPTPAPGDILFQDDFSDNSTGWAHDTDDDAQTLYWQDEYRIYVAKSNWSYYSNPGKNFTDVSIEVDARKSQGPDENDFGIICRWVDEQNFYYATIGSDGYYSISKVVADVDSFVGMDDYQFNDTVILGGDAVNHLRLDCVGDKLAFYVNGTLLIEAHDSSLTQGDVGLIAGAYDEPNVGIHFDNLVVKQP